MGWHMLYPSSWKPSWRIIWHVAHGAEQGQHEIQQVAQLPSSMPSLEDAITRRADETRPDDEQEDSGEEVTDRAYPKGGAPHRRIHEAVPPAWGNGIGPLAVSSNTHRGFGAVL